VDGPGVHHDLQVTLRPVQGVLEAEATLRLPQPGAPIEVTLHAGLAPRALEPGASLEALGPAPGPVPLERFRVRPAPGEARVTLRYAGPIRHPVIDASRDGGRPMPTTPGLIDQSAVYLDGGSGWYPDPGAGPLTFSLTVELPAGWHSVSQGRLDPDPPGPGTRRQTWRETSPQDGIYLVAAPFARYRRATDWGEAQVYLRGADPALAERYLEATDRYVGLYSRLIGPYPYAKFALVENAWETGYGMPSFTLLGTRVLRLPFILESSYPHEVLHNWWGNAVFIDYAAGNWAEGLTSYLADHLIQEQRGLGADYRRSALQKYADYVAEADDFPLARFRGRHGDVSQAVGYNKALMLFHMLRLELGDPAFLAGLRQFYREQRQRSAGWADLRAAFEAQAGRDLQAFFAQWVERTGAPVLELGEVSVTPQPGGYRVSGALRQVQAGPAYRLRIPVAVQGAGEGPAEVTIVATERPEARFALELPVRPLRLQVDPGYDVFRRLDPREAPASLGRLFGASRPLLVLPGAAPQPLQDAFRALAGAWAGERGSVALDRDLERLPSDRPVWVLGWENRWRPAVGERLDALGSELTAERWRVAGETLERGHADVVAAVAHPDAAELALGWIGSDDPQAVAALARRLPHYGKYSYLAFARPGLEVAHKGQWPTLGGPLTRALDPAGAGLGVRTPPRPPLADLGEPSGPEGRR
jgi:hypothetical protein